MLINLFEEIPWARFIQLEQYKKLSLTEQQIYYDQYISDLNVARQNWLAYQNKGPRVRRSSSGRISCTAGMDVVFVIDYTGSMGSAIDNLKTDIASIIAAIITESNNDYRLGLVLFDAYRSGQAVDYASSTTYQNLPASQKIITPDSSAGPNSGNPGLSVYQALTALVMMTQNNSSSFDTALQQLNGTAPSGLPLGGGAIADGPEPGDLAIEEVINSDFAGAFRNDVAKLIITISDNYPGGYAEDYDANVISRLQTLATTSVTEDIQHLAMIDLSPSQTLNPDPMAANTGYRILTDNTGGLFVDSFTPADIITVIQDICVENA